MLQVAELWRYPVKSLQGERLDSAELTPDGLEGDRCYAIYDIGTGFGLTGRRHPELLFASARLLEGGAVEITLPDGSIALDDSELSAWLARPVALVSVDDLGERRYENPADFEHDSSWVEFVGAEGAFHDNAGARVSLVSTGTIGSWDRRRFRPNVVLEGEGEDAARGSTSGCGSSAA
jgi:uncharacterized protein YcbX